MSAKDEMLRSVLDETMPLFRRANSVLLLFLIVALGTDIYFLVNGVIEPKDRLVSSAVVIAFIAATAAEISAIIIAAITKFSK